MSKIWNIIMAKIAKPVKKPRKSKKISAYIVQAEAQLRPFSRPKPGEWFISDTSKQVKPIAKRLKSHYRKLYKKRGLMKPAEHAALNQYVEGSTTINNRLLKMKDHKPLKTRKKKSELDQYIVSLWALTLKCKIPNTVVVYRGMVDVKYEVGEKYQNPCFISTSIDESIAHNFNNGSIIQYFVPEGHPGIFVVDRWAGYELEVILPPLTEFTIVSKEKVNCTTYYKAVVIPHNERSATLT